MTCWRSVMTEKVMSWQAGLLFWQYEDNLDICHDMLGHLRSLSWRLCDNFLFCLVIVMIKILSWQMGALTWQAIFLSRQCLSWNRKLLSWHYHRVSWQACHDSSSMCHGKGVMTVYNVPWHVNLKLPEQNYMQKITLKKYKKISNIHEAKNTPIYFKQKLLIYTI